MVCRVDEVVYALKVAVLGHFHCALGVGLDYDVGGWLRHLLTVGSKEIMCRLTGKNSQWVHGSCFQKVWTEVDGVILNIKM